MLDELACKVAGHVWVQANDIEGVMTCTRCNAQAEQAPAPPGSDDVSESEESDSVIPEDRPWLEPPFVE
jgi:hypothetical protein